MAKRRFSEDSLTQPIDKPSILGKIGGLGMSGLSAVGNLLDLPGSSVRDVVSGKNPFDQWLTPFHDTNRTTGRDLNSSLGLAGKKDTYGNWWGGLGAEIATDPLTYLSLGGSAIGKGFGTVAAKSGIHGLGAAKIASEALGRTVGPREARLVLTGDMLAKHSPEQFKTLQTVSRAKKQPFDLMNHMQEPLGALGKFWPMGDSGLIGKGETARKIAWGLDQAGDLVRHAKIPGTTIRPVGDLANLVNAKAMKAVNAKDLQAAYHAHGAKEGARYEANLLTAKWTNDLIRAGHKKTEALEVRNWFEFPHTAPAEVQPLVHEVRQYLDRIPAIAAELGVKIGDLTPKLRAAGSQADYFMRHLAEGITTGKGRGGKMFDPGSLAELERMPWSAGSRKGTLGLAEISMDPLTEQLATKAKNPKSLERYIGRKYGLKFDALGNEIGGILPAKFLSGEQTEKLKGLGLEPTVASAEKVIGGLKGTKEADVIKFRDLLKAKGNLNHQEADAITKVWRAWAEGYHGTGLGDALRKYFKGMKYEKAPPANALFQEHAPAFYSKLAQVAEQKVGGKIDQNQLLAMLKNNGVKEEEIADMGIEGLFAGKKHLTKQELMDHLHENAVELKEVTKGGSYRQSDMSTYPPELVREVDEIVRLRDHGGQISHSEATARINEVFDRYKTSMPKFDQYKTPGGENYREMLLQMPDPAIKAGIDIHAPGSAIAARDAGVQAFQSGHWDEPNVLAHIRFQDHTDAAGKKVLLIDEIQSDWHQAGRKKGYNVASPGKGEWESFNPQNPAQVVGFNTREEAAAHAAANPGWDVAGRGIGFVGGVPDSPFKKSWHTLAMKRMIRHAAENGYDRVAWTKGADQAARYDLSTAIDGIKWGSAAEGFEHSPEEMRFITIEPKGGPGVDGPIDIGVTVTDGRVFDTSNEEFLGKRLDEIIGKEHADRILTAKDGELSGSGLAIGGEGMKGFYDEILPNDTNKLIKKHGAKVGETVIEYSDETKRGAYGPPITSKAFHAFDITPSMREEALNKGQALYQKQGFGGPGTALKGAVSFDKDGKAMIYAFHHTDVSTHLHELSHIMRRHLTPEDQRIADTFVGATGQWSIQHEEKFARGFENYIRTGQATSTTLGKLFDKLKKWMTGIYQSIVGTPLDMQLSPEIKELYGRLVARPPKGGAKLADELRPGNTFKAAAETLRGLSPEVRKAGIYANHPINDFAASMSGTMDKIASSKVALEHLIESAGPAGQGTVPVSALLKALDLDAGDGATSGAVSWLKKNGLADPDNSHIQEETAKFLTQMHEGLKGGPESVHAMVKLYDDIANFTKMVFTNLDPVRFNTRNLASGQAANVLAGLDEVASGASRDANRLIRGDTIPGASKNPFIVEEATKRGIQNLDDQRATQILSEMLYAREATGSYGVSALPQHGQSSLGGKLEDVLHGIPGAEPFRWGNVLDKARGGFGKSGTTLNPIASYRGVGGAEKTTQALAAAGEDISHWTESMNRIAPMWALMQNGVHPDEAIRRVLQAQVGYQRRFYTSFEQDVAKRVFLFYSFSKGMFPFTLQQLIEQPGGRLAQTLRGMNLAKGEDELVPQHVAETASIPVPELPGMKPLEAGAKRYITGFGMGFEDPAQFAVPSLQNLGLEALSRANPLIKGPLEAITGQSFFQRAPGGGGRSLEDLDPALGRTLSNIGNITGTRTSKAPVRYAGSSVIEHMLSNSPLSNLLNKARTATDPRKGIAAKGINLLTGLKATDVSQSAQDRELRNRVNQLEKSMGARTFVDTYLPKDVKADMSPAEQQLSAQLAALKRLLEERSKYRKK